MALDPTKKIVAFILIIGTAITILLTSEIGRLRDRKAYDEFKTEIIELTGSEPLDASLEGKFVCFSGKLSSSQDYVDPEFGYTFPVVKLSRDVEYWQIVENEHVKTVQDESGRNVQRTSYTYESEWMPKPVTEAFHDEKNMNEVLLTLDSKTYVAQRLTLGPYMLAPGMIASLNNSALKLPDQTAERTAEASDKLMEFFFDKGEEYFHQSDNMYYFGLDPTDPSNGDVRVKFSGFRKDQTITVIAKVSKGWLERAFVKDKDMTAVKVGEHSLRNMRGKVASKGKSSGWVLRFGMWLILSCGFMLLFEGQKYQMLKAFSAGTVLFMLVVFIPWMKYRWYLGVFALLVAALAAVYLAMIFLQKGPKGIDDNQNPNIVDIPDNTGKKNPGKKDKSDNSGKSGSDIPAGLPEDVGDNIQTFDL